MEGVTFPFKEAVDASALACSSASEHFGKTVRCGSPSKVTLVLEQRVFSQHTNKESSQFFHAARRHAGVNVASWRESTKKPGLNVQGAETHGEEEMEKKPRVLFFSLHTPHWP